MRARLVEKLKGFAEAIAARMFARRMRDGIEFDEYRQLAMVGLLESVERYDPARGAGFKTFAGPRIRGAILNGLEHLTERHQQMAARRRLELERTASLIPEGLNTADDALLSRLADIGVSIAVACILDAIGLGADDRDRRMDDPYSHTELRQVCGQVKAAIERLPDRERQIIEGHYGQGRRFEEIATDLGLSRARVSQLHREAVERLRRIVSKMEGCDVVY